MIDSYIYIIDDLVFFCTGLLLLYLFVMAIASHFKHITYPKAQKEYGCAILVPEGSILPDVYKEEEYEFITYSDLYQAINSLDQERYDLVLFLSNTACALSPQFLNKIDNAYDAGVQAIQLHTIVENRKGIRGGAQKAEGYPEDSDGRPSRCGSFRLPQGGDSFRNGADRCADG